MKNEIIKRIKDIEKKIQKKQQLERNDNVFLFALSLIKGKRAEEKTK